MQRGENHYDLKGRFSLPGGRRLILTYLTKGSERY